MSVEHNKAFGEDEKKVNVGRRVFLGLGALGALGIAFGNSVENTVGNILGSGFGGLLPGGDRFRIYSITGGYPKISKDAYRLTVTGLVDHPTSFTFADLQAMPKTSFVKAFQCVTGWRVPDVHWEGVKLADILDAVGVQPGPSRSVSTPTTMPIPKASLSIKPDCLTSSWPIRCSVLRSPPNTAGRCVSTSHQCSDTSH